MNIKYLYPNNAKDSQTEEGPSESVKEFACATDNGGDNLTPDSLEAQEKLNSALQQFGSQVGIVCALEHGGKIDPKDAYKKIKVLFKELKGLKRSAYPKKNEAS